MKAIKYPLYLILLYVLIVRPPLLNTQLDVTHAHTLPEHVASRLGTATSRLQGLDISHYNGKVNFHTVQQHFQFVYLKATQGEQYVDPSYQAHVSALADINMLSGAYHFFDPDVDARQQAIHFVTQVKNTSHRLPPALDVELADSQSPAEIKLAVKQWLEYVHKALGCKPLLYSYGDYWEKNLGSEFNAYGFWLADYANTPALPKGLKNWYLWQYSDKGRVSGVQNAVDLNVLMNDGLHCYD